MASSRICEAPVPPLNDRPSFQHCRENGTFVPVEIRDRDNSRPPPGASPPLGNGRERRCQEGCSHSELPIARFIPAAPERRDFGLLS